MGEGGSAQEGGDGTGGLQEGEEVGGEEEGEGMGGEDGVGEEGLEIWHSGDAASGLQEETRGDKRR